MRDTYFVFPIHSGTVVTGLTAEIDGHFIEAKVMERREAQEAYKKAIKESKCAALAQHGASQARNGMDLYRVSLGNIPTHKSTFVNFSYVQELNLEDSDLKKQGFLRLLFPATVGAPSRYSPAGFSDGIRSEEELQAATHQAPSLKLQIAIQPPARVSSPSHKSISSREVVQLGDMAKTTTLAEVDLRQWDDIVKDVVVHIHFPAEDIGLFRPRAILEQHPTLKTWVAAAEVVPRFSWDLLTNVELSILVDRSGSMGGSKILFAREALEHFIRSCPFQAFVNIVGFGSSFESIFASAHQLKDEAFEMALEHARTLQANLGGTDLAPALRHVLSQSEQDGRWRRLLVLTDGEVWNANEVIATAEQCGEKCEIHTLGLGSGVSTALLESLARKGKGSAHFLADGEEEALQETVVKMLASALQPPVTDLKVHWPSSPTLLRHRMEIQEKSARQTPIKPEGIFQEGPVQSPSEILDLGSVETEKKRSDKQHQEYIKRFRAQGGFRYGTVQVGRLASLRSGQRWSAYAFLGLVNHSQIPSEIAMTGKMNDQVFDLKLPVTRSTGRTVHVLAAWHLAETLETSGAWSELGNGHGLPWEEADWQVIALGLTFGIATSKTSWIAVPPEEHNEAAGKMSLASMGSSLSLRSFARLGSSLAVLDFTSLGSTLRSLSLRSFCRLGSTLSVYGMARLGSSISVMDCMHMGSSISVKEFSLLGTSRSTLALTDAAAAPTPKKMLGAAAPFGLQRAFISLKVSKSIAVPIMMVTLDKSNCSYHRLPDDVAPLNHLLRSWSGVVWSSERQFGFTDLGTTDVTTPDISESVGLTVNCHLHAGRPGQTFARLNFSELGNQSLDFQMAVEELQPDHLEMEVSKWGCPQWPRSMYFALLESQRADGGFDWPVKFLQLHGANTVTTEIARLDYLPTAFAIAALRRCFSSAQSALVEHKAIAWLQANLEANQQMDRWIAVANAMVLQRFMWKVE
ncbi:unnamed protein product [Durusdinium trenchii]|uniref:von Willebrand factor A domain-containing protein 5A n=2 Tax=Durusdinium trenchii TaxID=1381693 RepID=A0ABP0RJ40_9DINO